jgi:DNA topoisomerase VI subunit B
MTMSTNIGMVRDSGVIANGRSAPAALERTIFEFSRAGEYVEVRELQTMTGQPADCFPDVVLKELLDNALDAAEKAGVAPEVEVRLLRRGRVVYVLVRDNGAGIDDETVKRTLNFETRTSDKAAYRSPTRGAQGNALKTIVSIPKALGTDAPVYIEARGVRHRIRVGTDPAGKVRVQHDQQDVADRPGTLVAVPLPQKCCGWTDFASWVRSFALFNPHATVRILVSRRPSNQR